MTTTQETLRSASDWAQVMADLRNRKPRPIHKLWINPRLAPPLLVAEQHARIKAWRKDYRFATKMQKAALETDNAAFYARQAALRANEE